ncbi:MAG: hypothetical protein QOK89_02750 [Nitrososphaeraceae archaeon]|nr:hypothetical protein [Nitrososphaeraceae archaeon]
MSKTIHTPLSQMNLLFLLIRITGKNGRQTYAIKTEMLLTLPHLYYYNNLLYVIKIVFIAIFNIQYNFLTSFTLIKRVNNTNAETGLN